MKRQPSKVRILAVLCIILLGTSLLSTLQPFRPTHALMLLGIEDGVFNVREFGGRPGDGFDDLQAAIDADARAAKCGGIVFFPPGKWQFSNEFKPHANVTVAGVGQYASEIAALPEFPSATALIQILGEDRVTVQDLSFTPNATALMTAVNVTGSSYSTVQRCLMRPGFQWSVFIGNPALGMLSDHTTVDSIRAEGTTVTEAIAIVDSNYNTIKNSHITATTGVNCVEIFTVNAGTNVGNKGLNNIFEGGNGGWHGAGDIDTQVEGNKFIGQTGNCLLIDKQPIGEFPSTGGTAKGNTFFAENLVGNVITMSQLSRGWTISGNEIRRAPGLAVRIQGWGHTVTANTVFDSGHAAFYLAASYTTLTANAAHDSGAIGIAVAGSNNVIAANIAADLRAQPTQAIGLLFEPTATNNKYGLNQLTGTSSQVLDQGTGNMGS